MKQLHFLLIFSFLFFSCTSDDTKEKTNNTDKPLTQQQERTEVTIGNQTWMVKNLDVKNFSNGDTIFIARTQKDWDEAYKKELPACSEDLTITDEFIKYPNRGKNHIVNKTDTSVQVEDMEQEWDNYHNGQYQGRVYNWWAVIDKRGLAPKGYHIPTKEEYVTLFKNVLPNLKFGWEQCVKPKLKEIGWYIDRGEPNMTWWTSSQIYEPLVFGGWVESIDFRTINVYVAENVCDNGHYSPYRVKVLKDN